ncbi:glycosyltransferase family 1 protein [Peribacillus sp. JNUCC 23]
MDGPLRILHVVVNMNRGGAETLIMNLYRNIDRSKIQFDFLTSKEGVFDDEIEKLGGIIHRVHYLTDVGHFKYQSGLDEFFSKHSSYKVVHAHMDKMSGIVLRSAKKAGIPIRISHSHNTQSEGGFAAKMYKWYAGKFIIQNATNFFACSNKAAQWLFEGEERNARLLKNGIEYEPFAFSADIRNVVREELAIEAQTFVLGHVGRFAHQKNHSFLIDIFAEFYKNNKNSILVLVGDGPLKKEIQEKVTKLQLDSKVKFIGIRSDINRILQAFDVFVFPSFHEGLPVSLIEAQAAGLPCLISDQISKEVDLGIQLIQYLPINFTGNWASQLNKTANHPNKRKIEPNSLLKQGYSIKETAQEMKDFYLGISG